MDKIKYCLNCGKELTSKQRKYNNKFCSSSCFGVVNSKNKSKGKSKIANCEFCGVEFILGKNSSGKYCSKMCSSEAIKKRSIDHWLTTGMMAPTRMPDSIKAYILDRQGHKCAICGMDSVWEGKPLLLIFDHIDGDSSNNNQDNIRAVCSNCDSQLDTYKYKNRNSSRAYRRQRYADGKSY